MQSGLTKSTANPSTYPGAPKKAGLPRGSRYLIIKELGLKDHDYDGFWGLSP